jgi:hypothetical protein
VNEVTGGEKKRKKSKDKKTKTKTKKRLNDKKTAPKRGKVPFDSCFDIFFNPTQKIYFLAALGS